MDLAIRHTKECWRCFVELTEQDRHCVSCPRCGEDLRDEGVEGLVDEKARRKWIAAKELGLIFTNWVNAYLRLLDEAQEANYSLLDDFIVEVIEVGFPYIKRLMDTKNINAQGMEYVRDVLNEGTLAIIARCQYYEEIYRLEGKWSETDESNKREWLERLGCTSKTISSYTIDNETPQIARTTSEPTTEGNGEQVPESSPQDD